MLAQPDLEYAADDGDGHHDAIDPDACIVKLGGMFGKAFEVKLSDCGETVTVKDLETKAVETVRADSRTPLTYQPEKFWAHLSLNGKCRTLQVLQENMVGEVPMQMYGANYDVLVQSPKEHRLSLFMHPPIPLDTANIVQSPMPGTLISYAVSEGDAVEDGQELCIVEAMKMQNIIRAPRAGIIKSCKVAVGGALKNDEVIIEYEKVEGDEE